MYAFSRTPGSALYVSMTFTRVPSTTSPTRGGANLDRGIRICPPMRGSAPRLRSSPPPSSKARITSWGISSHLSTATLESRARIGIYPPMLAGLGIQGDAVLRVCRGATAIRRLGGEHARVVHAAGIGGGVQPARSTHRGRSRRNPRTRRGSCSPDPIPSRAGRDPRR